jgi:hypothetical protein
VAGRAALDDPGCRRALGAALADADRLVLLGDVLELRERPLRELWPDARPALEAIAAGLPSDAEVVVVAGNHDHRLVDGWLHGRTRAEALGVAAEVAARDGEPVAELVAVLGVERTRVAYPGVWPADDVWATHGHYLDRHTTVPILERLAAGATARVAREPAGGPARAEDYEAALAPVYAWIDALAEARPAAVGPPRATGASERAWRTLRSGGGLRGRALRAGFPLCVAALERGLRSGPLSADLSVAALRRGPLNAIGEVTRRLAVSATHVLFGHTHRAGPLPGDDPEEWRTPDGARLLNTGGWVRETTLLGPDPARSPYRPGFAAWLDDEPDVPPRLVNLLD